MGGARNEPVADERLLDALVQVSYGVVGVLTEVAAANDLSLTQLRVLAILVDHEPRMAELADHLGLDRSTISGLVDRAEARGLVARFADPDDGRSSRVRLTRQGQRLAARGRADITGRLGGLSAGLADAERSSLVALLERLLAARDVTS